MNKQTIWSAAPCVVSHQLNNIKAVLHVKPALFSPQTLEFLANGQLLSREELSLEGRQWDTDSGETETTASAGDGMMF